MTPSDAMTQAQRDARAQAIKLLGEHFEAFVLIVEASVDDDGEDIHNFWLGAFDGGSSAAIGLMEKYKAVILPIRGDDD